MAGPSGATAVTVSLTDDVSLFGALGLWLSGRYALAPREEFFKPGESEQQVQENNERAFSESQTAAEVAALHHLKYPGMVIANQVTKGSPAENVIPLGARIISVNGKQVQSAADVSGALENTKPGDRIEVAFEKDGTSQNLMEKLFSAMNKAATAGQSKHPGKLRNGTVLRKSKSSRELELVK